MNFKPMRDRVLIKLDSNIDEKTEGGLYIPSSAQLRVNKGTVMAVGNGKQNNDGSWPLMSKVGDKVLLPEYSGLEVSLPEGKFLLFSQDEILGTFTE